MRQGRSGKACGWALVVVALAVSVVRLDSGEVASGAPARQDEAAAQATATREAELAQIAALQAEVAALQTQVAEQCLEPTPTVEPTPVPPSPIGQPVAYAGDWTVVVGGATLRPAIEVTMADGVFIELPLTITLNGTGPRSFPYSDFVLVDGQGRSFGVDIPAMVQLDGWVGVSLETALPGVRQLVFDVATDAGETLVLESKTDPAFRVEIVLQQRG
jgi:hypothetical protein